MWGENQIGVKPIILDLNQALDLGSVGDGPTQIVVDGAVVTQERELDGPVDPLSFEDKLAMRRAEAAQREFEASLQLAPRITPQPVQPWRLPPGVIPNQQYVSTGSRSGAASRSTPRDLSPDRPIDAALGNLSLSLANLDLNHRRHSMWENERVAEQAAVDDMTEALAKILLQPNEARCSMYDPLTSFMMHTGCELTERAHDELLQLLTIDGEPESLAEARQLPDWDLWWEACVEEWKSLKAMNTFRVVPRPKGRKVISSKIVFKLKMRDGRVDRRKARICARGFSQVYGKDYTDSFAAMAHPSAIRLILAIAAQHGWYLNSTDIKVAFLAAELHEEIYMEPPEGFEEPDGSVWLMLMGLYGLMQSGRNFWRKLASKLYDFGFHAITSDECCFIYRENNDVIIIATVVDDLVQTGNSRALLHKVLTYLREHFNLTDDGDLEWFLGVAYRRLPDGSIEANQTAYIEKCLKKFHLEEIAEKSTPMATTLVLQRGEGEPDAVLQSYFRALIGSLIYLVTWTRPDIAFAVNYLARFMACPTKQAVKAAHHVFAYLKKTKGHAFIYHGANATGRPTGEELYAYTDSSDADCKDTRRSTGGYLVFYNGTPVSWSSALQKIVALSSCESEYIQAALGAKEILYLREILQLAGFGQRRTTMYIDNKAALDLSENPVQHGRTKHIGRRWHFLRECVREGLLLTVAVEGKLNVADIFTKPLSKDAFEPFITALSLRTPQGQFDARVCQNAMPESEAKIDKDSSEEPKRNSNKLTIWSPRMLWRNIGGGMDA